MLVSFGGGRISEPLHHSQFSPDDRRGEMLLHFTRQEWAGSREKVAAELRRRGLAALLISGIISNVLRINEFRESGNVVADIID